MGRTRAVAARRTPKESASPRVEAGLLEILQMAAGLIEFCRSKPAC